MDCCNYMDYPLQSIYNYNRTQYNDTGTYHSSNGYHNPIPPTYCSYNNFGSNNNGYHYPSAIPNHVQNHHAVNFNEYSQRNYYNTDRTNSNYLHYDGGPNGGGHAAPPPPPPPLPPSSVGPHLFGATASSSSSSNGTTASATDYQYNPKEARIRKAQRDAIKVAQRQAAASAVPLHQPPGYSPLSNTSRLDMNSTSPMQQFIPAYTSQQTLGQNVGSISGGGIINAGASTSLGSRPSALTLSNTTSRRPPPPAYPGLPRQQSFHHGLEPNHREYGIVYGEPNFNPLPNMYSNNQNISTPSESHTTGMFDSQYQSNAPMESGMWNGMSHSSSMWNPQNFDIQRQHSLNDYSPFQSPTDQHSRNHLIPTTSTATTGNNLDDPNMFNHSDFPTDFPSKITAEAQKKVLDLVVANDYITMPKLNSRLSIAVPHNYGIFNHTIASPTFYDLNFMNYYYQISLNSNNNNDIPILRTCFESQNKIFTTPNAAIKYHGGIFQQVNPGIMSDTQNSSSEDINNNSTLFQDKEENDNQVMSTTLISSTNGIIDITDDDAINTNIANGNLSKQ